MWKCQINEILFGVQKLYLDQKNWVMDWIIETFTVLCFCVEWLILIYVAFYKIQVPWSFWLNFHLFTNCFLTIFPCLARTEKAAGYNRTASAKTKPVYKN